MNKLTKNKTTVLVLTSAILFGIIFWILDGILNFYFFREYLRFMIFQRPETLLESIVTNISFHALFVRISFLVACVIAGVLTAIFINRQKKVEEALRESEEKYRTLTENVNVGIYRNTLGPEGKFTEVNPAFVKMFGYKSRKELLSINVADLYQTPKDRKKFNKKMLSEGFVMGEKLQLIKKDGTLLIGSVSAVAVKDEKGKVQHYDGIVEDVTELWQAGEELKKYHEHLEELVKKRTSELEGKTGELEQANIRLQELDRLKSMFIASMSHELRTPLNSIIGFTGIILQGISGEITEDQRKELTMVKNSANHLLTLINDVIDVSKIETDRVELFIEEFNLADLMQGVKESFKVAADEKDLKLSLEMPERLIIKSDERRVKQVIMNLVSNAVKFTDRGEIEIKVRKEDKRVEVSVTDTGIGIKKEDMKKLFKQFSRIYVEGRPVTEGTGLGLYLSKKIVDLLGGQIKAESEFGKGSMFTSTFPLEYREVKV